MRKPALHKGKTHEVRLVSRYDVGHSGCFAFSVLNGCFWAVGKVAKPLRKQENEFHTLGPGLPPNSKVLKPYYIFIYTYTHIAILFLSSPTCQVRVSRFYVSMSCSFIVCSRSPRSRQRECQNKFQIECQSKCQIECQMQWQIESRNVIVDKIRIYIYIYVIWWGSQEISRNKAIE